MAATEAELEQKFTEVLASRAATAPCGAIGALDPPWADVLGRTASHRPSGHRRDLSPDAEPLPRRPSGPRQQLELHHEAQPGRRARSPSRRSENGPSQPPVDAIRRGKTMHPPLFAAAITVFAIVVRLVALE